MNDDTKISWPVAKAASLWAAIGVTSWAEAASFAAFVYSMILIGEWAWKKFKAARQREAS